MYLLSNPFVINAPVTNYNGRYSTEVLTPMSQYTRGIRQLVMPDIIRKYCINTDGHVFDIDRCEFLKEFNSGKYLAVTLKTIFGTSKNFHIHRLMAMVYCNPPRDALVNRRWVVNHIDGNKHNNCYWNLEWIDTSGNNQHARVLYYGEVTMQNGRPIVDEAFVNWVCKQFEMGKSNTEIMNEIGMENNNANHTLLRDIRGGYTWAHISSKYNFDRSSKKHAYTPEEKEVICGYLLQGLKDAEIFTIMQNRPYIPARDRTTSEYKTIFSLRTKLRKQGYNI